MRGTISLNAAVLAQLVLVSSGSILPFFHLATNPHADQCLQPYPDENVACSAKVGLVNDPGSGFLSKTEPDPRSDAAFRGLLDFIGTGGASTTYSQTPRRCSAGSGAMTVRFSRIVQPSTMPPISLSKRERTVLVIVIVALPQRSD